MIDRLSDALGSLAAIALGTCVTLVFALVVARYALGLGSPSLQDAAQWLHASAVLLSLGFAYRHGAHVRIDVLSNRWSERTRARAELLGIVVLLWPFCAAIVWLSWDYVALSWQIAERSGSTGGLAGLFLVKSLLPLGAALLALQGAAEAGRVWPAALRTETPA